MTQTPPLEDGPVRRWIRYVMTRDAVAFVAAIFIVLTVLFFLRRVEDSAAASQAAIQNYEQFETIGRQNQAILRLIAVKLGITPTDLLRVTDQAATP